MDFRIADTFTESLSKLTGDEQKAVKTTAFDLQMNPAHPGHQFHKLEKAKDKNFWSVRVNDDIRLIVHRNEGSLLLCFVAHHNPAYRWAERRKLETHPKTGAAQLVEIRETVKEIVVPTFVEAEPEEAPPPTPKPPLFTKLSSDDLLGYGVPPEWVDDVKASNEDSLLDLTPHLPDEAAEALLELATGGKPTVPQPVPVSSDPFQHPDAQRRFRVMSNVEDLEQALEYPWEKWVVFLHPAQKQLVERDFNGPARVAGSAGTGKTIVALHRAVFLAKQNPDARVLITTFSETLANLLKEKLRLLISKTPRLGDQIEVHAINAIGERLYKLRFDQPTMATVETVTTLLQETSSKVQDHKFSLRFLQTEWEEVIDAWQLTSWEDYRDVKRLGRKTRLPETQRALLWEIFSEVISQLKAKGLVTYPGIFNRLAAELGKGGNPPFEFAVVDEAQDISVTQLRFLAALGGSRPNVFFFAGDLGQRIFQTPFSWKGLGVDVRGRSKTLHINYRTSHQIRAQADRLLGPEVSDVDGITEDRRGTISVFNGPPPRVITCPSQEEEIATVSEWLKARVEDGLRPHEIAVIVRTEGQLGRAKSAIQQADMPFQILDHRYHMEPGQAALCTMHLAKGLEFKAVAIMACDSDILPLQERIESVTEENDLEEVYNTERHLLYVACTRARDFLLVTSGEEPSEFLEDFLS